jgi:hypothetical protein
MEVAVAAHSRGHLVLTSLPMVVPFRQRAQLLYSLMRSRPRQNGPSIKVRRNHLVEDSIVAFSEYFGGSGAALTRTKFHVNFVNEYGADEVRVFVCALWGMPRV